jgi:hypothetical protein
MLGYYPVQENTLDPLTCSAWESQAANRVDTHVQSAESSAKP